MSAFDLLRQVDREYNSKKKNEKSTLIIPPDIAKLIIQKVNSALTRSDLSGKGVIINGQQYLLTGETGLEGVIEDSYKNFYEGIRPKEGFNSLPYVGMPFKGGIPKTQLRFQVGNLETPHMLLVKKAFENLDLRMELKRKQEALKRKSDKLTLNQRNIAKLKDDLFVLISRIEYKQY
jgi:hypothetical protein